MSGSALAAGSRQRTARGAGGERPMALAVVTRSVSEGEPGKTFPVF